MTLPDFIGIGSMRCGSSWLHTLLDSHPQIYVPQKRIEVNYFTRYYHKGQDWYESYFPSEEEKTQYKVIGEVSPQYICFPEAVPRIQRIGTVKKFLTTFRDPVKRAYSDYGLAIREGRYSKPFADYVVEVPEAMEISQYAKQLAPFLDQFPQEQFLNLIFESATANVDEARDRIANFFNVDRSLFPEDVGQEKVNSTYVPRNKGLSLLATKVRYSLRQADLDGVITFAKRLGVESILKKGAKDKLPPIDSDLRKQLLDILMPDIERLEQMLKLDLSDWKQC